MRVPAFAICLLLCVSLAQGAVRTLESRHYRIHSDLGEELTRDLAQRMDDMHDEYARRLADFMPRGEVRKLEAYLFQFRRDYEAMVGGAPATSVGIFAPHMNALAAVLEGSSRTELRRTLQHEAFHQFAHNRIHPDMPVWLNEGLAELFTEGLWTRQGFIIGEVPPWRVQYLRKAMDERRLIDFQTMLSLSQERWNGRMMDQEAAHVQYVQAWAMAHMLVFETEGSGEPHYRSYLIDMLKRIRRGQDGVAAFRDAFGGNVKGFQDRFVAFAYRLQPTEAAIYAHRVGGIARAVISGREAGRSYATIDALRSDLVAEACQLIDGTPMSSRHLHFARNPVFHLPDIVCRPHEKLEIRARFFRNPAGKLDHELLFE